MDAVVSKESHGREASTVNGPGGRPLPEWKVAERCSHERLYFIAAKAPLTFDLISLLFLFIAKPPSWQDTQSYLSCGNPVQNLCKNT